MSERPNVLLITADHWPAMLLGAAGHASIHTPTLDQLCANGVRFPRAYSECPVCIPARRTLLTGLTPRTHGDRIFDVYRRMPDATTVAQAFRDAGYQAYAVGKLHVYPPRDRVGFDDVILAEEGRPQYGWTDDYEIFLGDRGFVGQQFLHGMSNNDYLSRPWHLPEDCHVTNWTTFQMVRTIQRRDPTKPAFWHLSYCHPHPPLAPLACYLDMYREIEPELPVIGDWASDPEQLPYFPRGVHHQWERVGSKEIRTVLRAFFALCTHIDHQLRLVLGTLNEEGLFDNTIVLFTSDHGDMLGDHGLWAKRLFYEGSANVPMILVGRARDTRVAPGTTDDRLVGWQDIMPTLLDLAGAAIPASVEGLSMVGPARRDYLYGECNEDATASRMIHDGRFKLIYYPAGNRVQLFDLECDPRERHDLSESGPHDEQRDRLMVELRARLHGTDLEWIDGERLVGFPAPPFTPTPNRNLFLQRGGHWPPPPQGERGQ